MLVDGLGEEVLKLTGFIFDLLPSDEFTGWLTDDIPLLIFIQLDCLFGSNKDLFP